MINMMTSPVFVRVVASFLKGRSFYVSVECVTQDSFLSPHLYTAYTDDIPILCKHLREREEDVVLALYADDSTYFASFYYQVVATNKMQRLLDLLPDWLDKWKMAVCQHWKDGRSAYR
ncbi:unnamed protein product [Euphydryas editha]|uniref:Reverse transcriptase n=1 Tax=Euphydryas editha TaxID=104508 RepID=A0AAU9V5U3_EUPED|nr:unnamed protein product [Euphydryas editha]